MEDLSNDYDLDNEDFDDDEAGDDVVIVESAPTVVEEVAAPNVASNPAATVDEDEDEDEDFGFVPNIPILPNKTEDDDVNIVI